MIIWLALLIPAVAAVVLVSVPDLRKKTCWWEYLILFAPALILIPLFKYGSVASQTSDTEWWTNYFTEAQFYERWTEEWDEYHPAQYSTDSKGRSTMTRAAWTEHHVVHHPPKWYGLDNGGGEHSLSEGDYKALVNGWGNEKEKGISHVNQTSWGDGDMWYSHWNRKWNTTRVVTTKHTWENRVKCSKSVFNFPEVSEADAEGLFGYPDTKGKYGVPSILGGKGIPKYNEANHALCLANAEMGFGKNDEDGNPPVGKQIRMWILLFGDEPQDRAIMQENYWNGGNKNEMIVCIGTNKDHSLKWCYVFSWTEVEKLKIDIRDQVMAQDQLNLPAVVKIVKSECSKQWRRKQFADFSYLSVEPSLGCVLACFIVSFLVTAGVVAFVLMNSIDADGQVKFKYRRR